MRRIKLVLAALALVVAMFAAFAGPAMADNLNCRDARGNLIRCDGQFFAPVNTVNNGFFLNGNGNCFFDGCFGVSNPFFFNNFDGFSDCNLILPAVAIGC